MQPEVLVWPVLAPILKKIIKKNYFDKQMVEEDFEALFAWNNKVICGYCTVVFIIFLNCTDIAQNYLAGTA